jgi:MFS family permease
VFTVANALGFITGMVMFGALIFLPQYFQRVRGVSPTQAGLRLLPLLAGMLLLSISSGRLISKWGRYKVFVVSGTAVLAAGLAWMTTITITTNSWVLAAMLFVIGSGLGLFMQTLIIAVQNAIPWEYMGTGTAAVTFFRTLGGAIGAAVLGAILVEQERTTIAHYVGLYGPTIGPMQAFTHAMDQALLFATPVAVLAFLLSFLMRDVRLKTATGVPGAEKGAPPVAALE